MANTAVVRKRCMLLEIAPELRNRIYEEVFRQDEEAVIIDSTYHVPGILKTCKQIRSETIGMYYASNTFQYTEEADHDYGYVPRNYWLEELPEARRKLIPKIRYIYRSVLKDSLIWQEEAALTARKQLTACGIEKAKIEVAWRVDGAAWGTWKWVMLQDVEDKLDRYLALLHGL